MSLADDILAFHLVYAGCVCGLFFLIADVVRSFFITTPYDEVLVLIYPLAAICLGIGSAAVFVVGYDVFPGSVNALLLLGEFICRRHVD